MGQVDLARLSRLMRRLGLGPTELANRAGVDPAIVTRMFRGSDPRGTTLAKIADALGTSVDYLLGRSELPEIDEGNVTDILDAILKKHYGYDDGQAEAFYRQLEAFSPKQRDFPAGDELSAAVGAAQIGA